MKISKKIRSIVVFSLVVLLMLVSGVFLKNLFLSQIREKIQASFEYSHLHLSFFPPVLIIEDLQSRTLFPYFSAKRVEMRISYKSLLTRQKPFHVSVDRPLLRLHPSSREEEKRAFDLSLPVLVEHGTIREGEFVFLGEGTSFQSRGIDAVFARRENGFSVKAEAKENVFSPGPGRPLLEGKLSVLAEIQNTDVSIKKLRIDGADFDLEVRGTLSDFSDPEMSLETSFEARVPLIVDFLHLPFRWEGRTEGRGVLTRTAGEVRFQTDFSSGDLHLNAVAMGNVSGRFEANRDVQTVELHCRKGAREQEYLKLQFAKEKIEGTAQGFYLDPIISYFSLPWPVASPAWGSFALDEKMFEAELEFRDDYHKTGPGLFPFRGPVQFRWDLRREISISAQGLASTFANVDVSGRINVGQDLDLTIVGEVKDVRLARKFTSIILGRSFDFPEIRGEGLAEIRIFDDYDSPRVNADFSLTSAGYADFDFRSVEGGAEVIEGDFFGRFTVDDPRFEGKIGLLSNPEGVRLDIRLERGSVEKIFPALNIEFPLEGEASGYFELRQNGEEFELKGDFEAFLMKFVGQDIEDVRGTLAWREGSLFLSDLQFRLHEGIVRGKTSIGISSLEFDMDLQGDGIDLSSVYSGVQGMLGFHLVGKGVFGQEFASGPFEIKGLCHSPFQKTEARGEAKFGFADESISLGLAGNLLPGENDFHLLFSIPINRDFIAVDIRGRFTNLDHLVPWRGAQGCLNYLGEVKGPMATAQVKGAIDFQGPLLPWPGFAHAFSDYSGLIFVENDKLIIRSFQAKLGGGDVQGSGELKVGLERVETINLKLEGKNMLLAPLERTRFLSDGSLNLIKDSERFVLEGSFYGHRLQWKREVDEEFIFSSSPYYEAEKKPGFFDNLGLNIRLRADDNAWMENSLGRIRGRFDLMVRGSVSAPVVTGEIEALAGNVYFQDRRFKILNGRVNFFNPLATEPYISFKGETFIKDYRVTFSLDGLLDRLTPEFSSSPPLPPEDVLALLALGESFRRTYSYDTSTQLSTTSLLSFQIAEEAKKRAEGLFSIDRFRIDPFVMGSSAEMTARLTVGKKVSRNFFILYSTNLTTQREEIARIEWELTNDLSIVGTRNEEGRISFDVKIHKRF